MYLFDLKQTKSLVQALNLPFVNNAIVSYCELNPEERKSRDTQDILFARGLPVFTRANYRVAILVFTPAWVYLKIRDDRLSRFDAQKLAKKTQKIPR